MKHVSKFYNLWFFTNWFNMGNVMAAITNSEGYFFVTSAAYVQPLCWTPKAKDNSKKSGIIEVLYIVSKILACKIDFIIHYPNYLGYFKTNVFNVFVPLQIWGISESWYVEYNLITPLSMQCVVLQIRQLMCFTWPLVSPSLSLCSFSCGQHFLLYSLLP